jgi:hypothetical protein
VIDGQELVPAFAAAGALSAVCIEGFLSIPAPQFPVVLGVCFGIGLAALSTTSSCFLSACRANAVRLAVLEVSRLELAVTSAALSHVHIVLHWSKVGGSMFAGIINMGEGAKPKSLASYVTGLPSVASLVGRITFHVQNIGNSEPVYLGDSSVTTSDYGRELAPGESFSITLEKDFLYATSAASGTGTGRIAFIVSVDS